MMIGHYAHLEKDDEREDPLYEWLRSNDLDTGDGGPEPTIANVAREEGVNLQRILEERTPLDDFDPLTRSRSTSQSTTKSSSRTKSSGDGGGDDDDDDEGSNGGGGGDGDYRSGGVGSTSSTQRPLSPFTAEADFAHATQDDDHGARPPMKSYVRKYGSKKKAVFTEEDDLIHSMAATSIGMDNSDQGSNCGYTPYDYYVGDHSQEYQQSYVDDSSSQIPYNPDDGTEASSSSILESYVAFPGSFYGYWKEAAEVHHIDDEVNEPARVSFWW